MLFSLSSPPGSCFSLLKGQEGSEQEIDVLITVTSRGFTGMKMKADSSAVLCGFLMTCCGPGYSAGFHKGKPLGVVDKLGRMELF